MVVVNLFGALYELQNTRFDHFSVRTPMEKHSVHGPRHSSQRRLFKYFIAIVLASGAFTSFLTLIWNEGYRVHVPQNAERILGRCRSLDKLPGPPSSFYSRSESDRFVPGTPATLIKNATLWTGRANGHEVVIGSLLLDKGIIKDIGIIEQSVIEAYDNLVEIDVGGAWVTPG